MRKLSNENGAVFALALFGGNFDNMKKNKTFCGKIRTPQSNTDMIMQIQTFANFFIFAIFNGAGITTSPGQDLFLEIL